MLKPYYLILSLSLLSWSIHAQNRVPELTAATEQTTEQTAEQTAEQATGQAAEQAAHPAQFSIRGEGVAGEVVYAEISYQLPVSLVAGGSIVFQQQRTQARRLQIANPAAINFLRIVSEGQVSEGQVSEGEVLERQVSEGEVLEGQLRALDIEGVGFAGDADYKASEIGFEVTSGVVKAGTVLRFIVDRLQLPTTATADYGMPLYLYKNQETPPTRVLGNSIQISPGEFSELRLSSSSIVKPAEVIDLWLRLEDKYGNIAQARNLSLDLLVNGVFRERLDVVASVQKIDGISFQATGSYRLEVRTGGGGMSAMSNPVLVGNKPYDIIWADLGARTELSKNLPSAEALATAAMGRYALTLPVNYERSTPPAFLPGIDNTSIVSDWKSLKTGGASVVLSKANVASFTMAKPEHPTDLRRMVPESLQLVEIVSGGSVYDWFGNKAALMGFRIGFVGSNHSHQYPGRFKEVNNAIWLTEGQDWFDALSNHQTYVSVGSKMVLAVSPMNLGMEPTRKLGLEIVAEGPIVSVKVFKNGRLFKTRRQFDTSGNRFRLVVESPSEPFSRIMSKPRNAREWLGYVVTQGEGITVNQVGQAWRVQPGRQLGRVDFLTRTHGLNQFLEFELGSANADTVIEIGIAPGYEDAAWIPNDRLPQPTSGQKFLIPIAEAILGATRTIEVEGYQDSVRIEPALVPFGASMRFNFEDPSTPHIGDYYYFRVRLEDGSFAYTSPIYVGDFE